MGPTVADAGTDKDVPVASSQPARCDHVQLGIGGGGGAAGLGGLGGSSPPVDNQIIVERPGLPAVQAAAADDAARANGTLPRKIIGGELLLVELTLPPNGSAPPVMGNPGVEGNDANGVPRSSGIRVAKAAEESQARATELRDRILKRNPYVLTRYGVLQLPGLDPIPLGGLTEIEARERLAVDPILRVFTVAVTLLRVNELGAKALKPFGYDMFRGAATALVPGTDIPVPDDYKVGPGDSMSVQLYGQTTQVFTLPVGRDGAINLPALGPINVAGLGFGSARSLIESRVKKELIGTHAKVSLSDLRSARVLVLGDAEKPGSYVLSALATATTALFASGGVKPIGSLRQIEVRRDGSLVRRLDLYDVLLKGNTNNDVHLQSGDAVFIPPVGPTVSVDGEVRRPAIYEMARERTVGDVLAIAGGLTPEADQRSVTVERVEGGHERTVRSLDLGSGDGRAFVLKAGDILRIPATRPVIENGIALEGHVYRPGIFAYRAGLRISDVIPSADDLKPRADLHYLLVRREDPATRRVTVFSADLEAALARRGTSADLALQPRDKISVFDLVSPRDSVVDPLLEEVKRQASPGALAGTVSISGRVNAPGRYPLEDGMRLDDLLRAAGGLQDDAYTVTAELTHYETVGGDRRTTDIRQIDLATALHGDAGANETLHPYDLVTIKEMPEWGRIEEVEVLGEVRFPGKYRIRRGESLASVLERAGGLTPIAFADGAIFTREELKLREKDQIERLANRLQADIAALSLQASQTNIGATESMTAGQSLLQQLRNTAPVGRLVIDLGAVIAGGNSHASEITLRGGDRLMVPRQTQEVLVLGEVQNPTSYLVSKGLTRDKVIGLSGGFTPRADKKRAYVVRANGGVAVSGSGWFISGDVDVRPGDSVVVPVDAERMRPLPMWTAITTILYNLAIAATAIARL